MSKGIATISPLLEIFRTQALGTVEISNKIKIHAFHLHLVCILGINHA
jgi:hypothetical protein